MLRKGSKVWLNGKAGKFAFAINTIAGRVAYVDFKTSIGDDYFKICMLDELRTL